MHLFLITRGINRQVEEWKCKMQAAAFPWKRTNLDVCKCGLIKQVHDDPQCFCKKFEPREEIEMLQGALRPIQMWEYVVPEESLKDVLGALGLKGPIKRKELMPVAWMMRKMLKAEQIPEVDGIITGYVPFGTLNGEKIPPMPVYSLDMPGVAIYPVGIRKDKMQDADWGGKEGNFKQEMI